VFAHHLEVRETSAIGADKKLRMLEYHQYPMAGGAILTFDDFVRARRILRNTQEDALESSRKLRDQLKTYASRENDTAGTGGLDVVPDTPSRKRRRTAEPSERRRSL
jgi:hypothetical protein